MRERLRLIQTPRQPPRIIWVQYLVYICIPRTILPLYICSSTAKCSGRGVEPGRAMTRRRGKPHIDDASKVLSDPDEGVLAI